MSVAIRTATRIVDQDDFGSTPGAGNDGYALVWDNGAGEFVLAAVAPDLTGYALLAGRSGGQTLYGGTGANDDITIHGTSNATRTSSYVILQPTAGNVGIGTTSPATTVHALTTNTVTNAVTNVVTVGHNTSGTAAAGFGGGLAFNLQSSTTASQSAGLIASSWIVATHASRTARLALSAYDYNGAREGVRIDTDGSAALLGFYGHAAVAQQVLATGAGASVDNVISALQALGLVKQS